MHYDAIRLNTTVTRVTLSPKDTRLTEVSTKEVTIMMMIVRKEQKMNMADKLERLERYERRLFREKKKKKKK